MSGTGDKPPQGAEGSETASAPGDETSASPETKPRTEAKPSALAPPPVDNGPPAPRWLVRVLDHLWLLVLPLYVAAFIAVILITNRFDLSALPWPGLGRALLAGLLVAGLLGLPYLFFRRPYERAREELLLRRDAELGVKEARRRLKKQDKRLSQKARESVEQSIARLDQATKKSAASGDMEPVSAALTDLDKDLETYLAEARKGTTREYSESIGVAVIIALLLRAFVIEAFKIPSGSMIPTLQVGDHIFVKKFLYGARIPWTDIKLFSHLREPRRGEIIVFVFPNDPEKDYIKRIVGTPGDSVKICGDEVRINDKPLRREPVAGPCEYEDFDEESPSDSWKRKSCLAFREWNGDESYTIVQSVKPALPPELQAVRECREFLVPRDSVFVMGDNRDNSYDSRFWPFGAFVHYRLIKGKAWFIWWSTGERAVVRLGRMFTSIHK